MDSLELTKRAVCALDNKKAANIEALCVDDVTILGDYFIIASADNTTHVRALADELEYQLKKAGVIPRSIEGYQSANWIVMDYRDVIVHIFHEQARNYYNLEKLWSDGVRVDVHAIIEEANKAKESEK